MRKMCGECRGKQARVPDAFSYVAKCMDSDGNEVYVGPFEHKFQARTWLLNETGSPQGLVLLVLAPRQKVTPCSGS